MTHHLLLANIETKKEKCGSCCPQCTNAATQAKKMSPLKVAAAPLFSSPFFFLLKTPFNVTMFSPLMCY